jgi:hypothetical protein
MNHSHQALVYPLAGLMGRSNPLYALAGVAANADRSSILIFDLRRQGDKSHTADKNGLFESSLDMIV